MTYFYVETDGDNDNGGERASGAWATIQYAIDNDHVTEGDTIYIGEETFFETVVTDKGIALQGEGDDTIITAEDDATVGVTISSDDVSLEYLAVEGDSYSYGVDVQDGV